MTGILIQDLHSRKKYDKKLTVDSCHEGMLHICIECCPGPDSLKLALFIIQDQTIPRCVQTCTDRRGAIHQILFHRGGDDRYPSSDPELARPQSSATI